MKTHPLAKDFNTEVAVAETNANVQRQRLASADRKLRLSITGSIARVCLLLDWESLMSAAKYVSLLGSQMARS